MSEPTLQVALVKSAKVGSHYNQMYVVLDIGLWDIDAQADHCFVMGGGFCTWIPVSDPRLLKWLGRSNVDYIHELVGKPCLVKAGLPGQACEFIGTLEVK